MQFVFSFHQISNCLVGFSLAQTSKNALTLFLDDEKVFPCANLPLKLHKIYVFPKFHGDKEYEYPVELTLNNT